MSAYFSGQGRVFIGTRDPNGHADGLQFVGNVPELRISPSVETLEHQEAQSGQRLTDLQILRSVSAEFTCVLEELLPVNLALALYGNALTVAPGTVTDERLPNPLKPGHLYPLAKQNVSDVVLQDAHNAILPAAQYSVNARHGSLTLLDATTGGPYVQPFQVSYSFGAAQSTAMFTQPLPERWIRFEGLNTANANREVVIDLYRVSINPTRELSLISDELMRFELSGRVLADLSRPSDGDLGQFGRMVLL